jgi:hypothetical protein
MGRACGRAGLERRGAHRLRHALATRDAARGRVATGGRAGAPAPQPAVHGGLCQGRPERAAPPGAAVARSRGVSALPAAGEYLAMRRALGFRLTTQGRHLMSFVAFCEERGAVRVSSRGCRIRAELTARSRNRAGQGRFGLPFTRRLLCLLSPAGTPVAQDRDRRCRRGTVPTAWPACWFVRSNAAVDLGWAERRLRAEMLLHAITSMQGGFGLQRRSRSRVFPLNDREGSIEQASWPGFAVARRGQAAARAARQPPAPDRRPLPGPVTRI